MSRQMHLLAFLGTGPSVYHMGTWRHPETQNRFLESGFWEDTALTLESAKFDAAFFADGLCFYEQEAAATGGIVYLLDPVPLAANVLRATTKLGVGITMSTSFFEPWGLARTLGTLDQLSGGRLAWNVVTSSSDEEAQVFGMDKLPARDARYDRAEEIVQACLQLWDSFGPDALVVDKETGVFIDPAGLKSFDYRGRQVATKGPLSVPPSPQGRPIIMQAGASERGREFAARYAEIVFAASGGSLDQMQEYYRDAKHRVAAAGRRPDDCKIIPLIQVAVAATEREAREQIDSVHELMPDDAAIGWASATVGIDFRGYPLDEPIKNLTFGEATAGSVGFMKALEKSSRDGEATLLEAARRMSSTAISEMVGTPDQVADQMQEIFENDGADGFMVAAPIMPGSFENFARLVVPILQERGLFRTEYPGTTLRETLYS